MKVYKSSKDTLCIQGEEIKNFEMDTTYKGNELVDSAFNEVYDTVLLGYRFPGMGASKQMFYGSKLAMTTMICSMLDNMLLNNLLTKDELKEIVNVVIKQVRKSEKNARKDTK